MSAMDITHWSCVCPTLRTDILGSFTERGDDRGDGRQARTPTIIARGSNEIVAIASPDARSSAARGGRLSLQTLETRQPDLIELGVNRSRLLLDDFVQLQQRLGPTAWPFPAAAGCVL